MGITKDAINFIGEGAQILLEAYIEAEVKKRLNKVERNLVCQVKDCMEMTVEEAVTVHTNGLLEHILLNQFWDYQVETRVTMTKSGNILRVETNCKGSLIPKTGGG